MMTILTTRKETSSFEIYQHFRNYNRLMCKRANCAISIQDAIRPNSDSSSPAVTDIRILNTFSPYISFIVFFAYYVAKYSASVSIAINSEKHCVVGDLCNRTDHCLVDV